MIAADRLHVPPWELLERGRAWTELALVLLAAERRADAEIADRNERRQRVSQLMRGGRR